MDLTSKVHAVYSAAEESGDLLFTPTKLHVQRIGDLVVEIRMIESLAYKPIKQETRKAPVKTTQNHSNPFLPPDPALYVTSHNDFHLVLNKFCVAPYHLLLVTKDYQRQGDPLKLNEFKTACWTLYHLQPKYLLFYNAGPNSGASQPHKHLQLLPNSAGDTHFPPIFGVINHWDYDQVGRIALFPFRHYCIHLRPMELDDTAETRADYLHRTYTTLLNEMQTSMTEVIPSLVPDSTGATNGTESFLSYNFICTEDMMLLVPRRHKESNGISINSLGFAGLLLAKSPAELESIQTHGVFQVLADVGYPW